MLEPGIASVNDHPNVVGDCNQLENCSCAHKLWNFTLSGVHKKQCWRCVHWFYSQLPLRHRREEIRVSESKTIKS
jgi:hypothetical protein